jgi:hypothetical protein
MLGVEFRDVLQSVWNILRQNNNLTWLGKRVKKLQKKGNMLQSNTDRCELNCMYTDLWMYNQFLFV